MKRHYIKLKNPVIIVLIVIFSLHHTALNATNISGIIINNNARHIYVDSYRDTIILTDTAFVFKTSSQIRDNDIPATLYDKTLAICRIDRIYDGFMKVSSTDYRENVFKDMEIQYSSENYNFDTLYVEFQFPEYFTSDDYYDYVPPELYQLDITVSPNRAFPYTVGYNYLTANGKSIFKIPRTSDKFSFYIRPHDILSRIINGKYEGIINYHFPEEKYSFPFDEKTKYFSKITIILPNFKCNYLDMMYLKDYYIPCNGAIIFFMNKQFHLIK